MTSTRPTQFVQPMLVRRVYDGDTIVGDVWIACRTVLLDQHIRITSRDGYFDAPERRTPQGRAALAFLETLLKPGDWITLTIKTANAQDNFGRLLATVTTATGQDVATEMKRAGHIKTKTSFE